MMLLFLRCLIGFFLFFEVTSASSEVALYAPLKKGVNAWSMFTMPRTKSRLEEGYVYPPYGHHLPRFAISDFHRVRQQGFDFIRLPIDPGPFLDLAEDKWPELMEDVRLAVRAALDEGLSVVLDVHPPTSHPVYRIDRIINSYPERRPDDLAGRFSRLNVAFAMMLDREDVRRTLLEPMNEPGLDCTVASMSVVVSVFNEIATHIRTKSSALRLVFEPPCQSSWKLLTKLAASSVDDRNVVYSFHFYEPFLFTHQGSTWSSRSPFLAYVKGLPFPSTRDGTLKALGRSIEILDSVPELNELEGRRLRSDMSVAISRSVDTSDESLIDSAFSAVASWSKNNNVRPEQIFLGEFGTLRPTPRSGPEEEDRERWLAAVRLAAESRGYSWAVWEYVDVMGIVQSDSDRSLIPSVQRALGLVPRK